MSLPERDAATTEAWRCQRCGGALSDTSDPQQLDCRYCGTAHLSTVDDDVPALMPKGLIGRRGAHSALVKRLREQGIKGVAVQELELHWLPFWQVRGKLVGWQVFHRTVVHESKPMKGPNGEEIRFSKMKEIARVEDLIAKDLAVTLPACDTRSFDLAGIAHRVDHLELEAFSHDRAARKAEVCAVIVPRAVAMRRARMSCATGLVPSGATAVRQRLSLIRSHLRLIYYPVWRLRFTVGGEPGEARVDGIGGKVLGGDVVRPVRSKALGWFAAAAVAGWLSGLHILLGGISMLAWALERNRATPSHSGSGRAWAAWLSEEIDPRPRVRVPLDP